ncbi:DUF6273 domain-containing protein [Clostridium perfringens]
MKKSLALFFTLVTTFSVVSINTVKANTDINSYTKGSVGKEIRGSGYWSSSNIREWLNSDKAIVEYTNNPPSSEFMGSKAYDKEAGFLNQFTEEEKKAIAISERRIWVNMGGAGSTGIACLNTNRKFIGIEKDAKYFDIACNRIYSHIS